MMRGQIPGSIWRSLWSHETVFMRGWWETDLSVTWRHILCGRTHRISRSSLSAFCSVKQFWSSLSLFWTKHRGTLITSARKHIFRMILVKNFNKGKCIHAEKWIIASSDSDMHVWSLSTERLINFPRTCVSWWDDVRHILQASSRKGVESSHEIAERVNSFLWGQLTTSDASLKSSSTR